MDTYKEHADLNKGRALRTTIELFNANKRAAPATTTTVKHDGFCTEFQKHGKCKRGDKCRFKHTRASTKAKAVPAKKGNKLKNKISLQKRNWIECLIIC